MEKSVSCIHNALADSTFKKYESQWNKYLQFKEGQPRQQDESLTVKKYPGSLVEMGTSPGSLTTAVAAISHFLVSQDKPDVTVSASVRKFLKGAKKENSQVTEKRETNAFSEAHMKKFRKNGYKSDCLMRKRLVALLAICFGGFMRISAAANLCMRDISLAEDSIVIWVKKVKRREKGYTVRICQALKNGPFILHYFEAAHLKSGSSKFFMPRIRNLGESGQKASSEKVSTGTLRKDLKIL